MEALWSTRVSSGTVSRLIWRGWRGFLRHLKTCRLAGVQRAISDAWVGLV